MPTWRIQATGAEDLIAVRKQGHPGPGRVTRWRADPTPAGFVFEFEERWNHEGQQWYAREMMRAEVAGGQIAELTVYCTGDWDQARQTEHAASVTPAPPVTPGRRRGFYPGTRPRAPTLSAWQPG